MGRTTPTTITPIMRMTIMTNQPIKTQRRDFTQGVSSTNLYLPIMYHQTQRRVHLWRKQLLWPRGGTLFALEDSSNKPYYINTVSHLNTLEKQEVTAWRNNSKKFECLMILCFLSPLHLVPKPLTLIFDFMLFEQHQAQTQRGNEGGEGERGRRWSTVSHMSDACADMWLIFNPTYVTLSHTSCLQTIHSLSVCPSK